MAGTLLDVLMVLGGWKTIQCVQRYRHYSPDYLRAAMGASALAAPAQPAAQLDRNYTAASADRGDVS
jgi:hypothetical protein